MGQKAYRGVMSYGVFYQADWYGIIEYSALHRPYLLLFSYEKRKKKNTTYQYCLQLYMLSVDDPQRLEIERCSHCPFISLR